MRGPRGHRADGPLEDGQELGARFAVVLTGIERRDGLGGEHGLEPAQAAALANDDRGLAPRDREAWGRPWAVADRASRDRDGRGALD